MAATARPSRRIHPVILSGGAGQRLWPLSRALYPKQFLALASELTLLQETARRLSSPELYAPPLVMCNDEHRFIVAEQLRAARVEPERIVLEPAGRNTAPAAAAAALLLDAEEPAALMLIAPSDHVVADPAGLNRAVASGLHLAEEGWLVTFGVRPDKPYTGFGYIERGEALGKGAYAVARFTEKPSAARAQEYLEAGGYYWNSGMFLFKARRYLEELSRTRPEIVAACREAVAASRRDLDFLRLDPRAFEACVSDSIDYAVMEKSPRVAVVPVSVGWNDVGSWDALWEIGAKDKAGNVLLGDALALDCRNSYVRAESGLIAALGLSGLVIVATGDAVLVAPRERAEEIKTLIARLLAESRQEAVAHPLVYRPWGSYESIKAGGNFQVKHLRIRPGAKLSLQYHNHRAEHWVVVKGTATIVRGKERFELKPDQSTYIPIGETHSIANDGPGELEIIEVQSGAYLGEDDIVRLEDRYGRS